MKTIVWPVVVLTCCALTGYSETWLSTGVDMSPYWNIDAWQVDSNDLDVPDAYCWIAVARVDSASGYGRCPKG